MSTRDELNIVGLDPGWRGHGVWPCGQDKRAGALCRRTGCVFIHSPHLAFCPLPRNAAHLLQLPPLLPALQDAPPLLHQVPMTWPPLGF